MAKLSSNTLGFKARKLISEYLETVLTVDVEPDPVKEGTGRVHYTDPDMDDEAVAAHFSKEWGTTVTKRNVEGVRAKAHGRMVASRTGIGTADNSALTTRLEATETTMLELVDRQARLEKQISSLGDQVAAIASGPVAVKGETSIGDKQKIREHTQQIASLQVNFGDLRTEHHRDHERLNNLLKELSEDVTPTAENITQTRRSIVQARMNRLRNKP